MNALLGAVWLYAADVPRSVEFFRDKVGLPLLEGEDFHLDAGNIRLSIHAARDGKPAGDEVRPLAEHYERLRSVLGR